MAQRREPDEDARFRFFVLQTPFKTRMNLIRRLLRLRAIKSILVAIDCCVALFFVMWPLFGANGFFEGQNSRFVPRIFCDSTWRHKTIYFD